MNLDDSQEQTFVQDSILDMTEENTPESRLNTKDLP